MRKAKTVAELVAPVLENGFAFEAKGIRFSPTVTKEQVGIAIAATGEQYRSIAWYQADAATAAQRVGYKLEDIAGKIGLAYPTVKQYVSTNGRIPIDLRSDVLTFTHHKVIVENLTVVTNWDADFAAWVAKAVKGDGKERWGTARLKTEMDKAKPGYIKPASTSSARTPNAANLSPAPNAPTNGLLGAASTGVATVPDGTHIESGVSDAAPIVGSLSAGKSVVLTGDMANRLQAACSALGVDVQQVFAKILPGIVADLEKRVSVRINAKIAADDAANPTTPQPIPNSAELSPIGDSVPQVDAVPPVVPEPVVTLPIPSSAPRPLTAKRLTALKAAYKKTPNAPKAVLVETAFGAGFTDEEYLLVSGWLKAQAPATGETESAKATRSRMGMLETGATA